MDAKICSQMMQLPFFYFLTWLSFSISKLLAIYYFFQISHKWWEIGQTLHYYCHEIGSQVLAEYHDIALYFQGHKISGNHIIFNIWKMVRASKKCSNMIFNRGWYWPSNGVIANVVHCDPDLHIFKVIKFLEIIYLISGKQWELAKYARVQLL